ncbi:MAG: HEAT repeat domain-containing protein [Clostridia bacterium]|nr:HEAT repeat domain-containing protein [Clostridia bacterium]
MKKFTALILAVLMLFTFAACGGGETPETPDVPESTTASEAPIKGEIHGIKLEQYAEMTGEDLVSKLVKDKTAPTADEYVAIIETIDFAEVDDRCDFEENATDEALKFLKGEKATFPNVLECADAVLANGSAKVRAYYYQQLNNQLFDETVAAYTPVLTKILSEKESIAIYQALRYTSYNYCENKEFIDFVISLSDSADANIRRVVCYAVQYIRTDDTEPLAQMMFKLIEDEDKDVRKEAVLYCYKLKDDRFVPVLKEILLDENQADLHSNAGDALCRMWYNYPAHDAYSEAAYKATMEYFKATFEDTGLPNWQVVNKISLKGKTNYDKWFAEASYFDAEEVVEIMKNIFNNASKDRLLREQCIKVVATFGDKADLEALQAGIDATEKEFDKNSLQDKLDAALAAK